MPSPLGEVHYWLHDEVAWLHLKWKAFRSLFATPPETIDLLNSTAPTFFSNLNRMMMEDVFLHLCRLTDPPRSAGKNTLTLRRLPTLIADPVLQLEVLVLTVVAERSTRFARDWRHRKLAHKELPPLDGPTADTACFGDLSRCRGCVIGNPPDDESHRTTLYEASC